MSLLNRPDHSQKTVLALALAGALAFAGCSSDSEDSKSSDTETTEATDTESTDSTEATDDETTDSTEATDDTAAPDEATGPVVHAAWSNAGDPGSSDKPWAVQKAKIEGNTLTLYLYTWEPTTTTPDWPWPEPSDYGEGDFFLEVTITAPGDLFQPAVYKDDQIAPNLSLADLGVGFVVPNGEIQVTSIDPFVTGELRIDDGYAQVTGSFEAIPEG